MCLMLQAPLWNILAGFSGLVLVQDLGKRYLLGEVKMKLDNKVTLVCATGRSIGEAIALDFGREGLREFIKLCLDAGFSDKEVKAMAGENAVRLIGL